MRIPFTTPTVDDLIAALKNSEGQGNSYNFDKAEKLIKRGADVNGYNDQKQTPLHYCIAHLDAKKDVAAVRFLLAQGADPNIKIPDMYPPLAYCIWHGYTHIAQALLEHGANPNIFVRYGQKPLRYAISRGEFNMASLLIDHGADINYQDDHNPLPLKEAARDDSLPLMIKMIQKGTNSNNLGIALLEAVSNNAENAAVVLLDYNADINQKDSRGCTPFLLALRYGQTEIVRRLYNRGANILDQDNDGNNALMHAVLSGDLDIIRFVTEKKAFPIDQRNNDGDTALIYAAKNYRSDGMEYLIAEGADIHARNNNGDTALTLALMHEDERAVRLLLENGARPFGEEYGENTPLKLAAASGNVNIILMLHEACLQPSVPKKSETADGTWAFISPQSVTHITTYPDLQRKMTDIFNFASRERIFITENTKTGAEAVAAPVSFDDLPEATVTEALTQFKKHGGTVDEDFVLYGTQRLHKAVMPAVSVQKPL